MESTKSNNSDEKSNPKGFMQPTASAEDPLKKRENFAISLRKKKKDELMQNKRQKLFNQAFGIEEIKNKNLVPHAAQIAE